MQCVYAIAIILHPLFSVQPSILVFAVSSSSALYKTKAASPRTPAATIGAFTATAAPVNSGRRELVVVVGAPVPEGAGTKALPVG